MSQTSVIYNVGKVGQLLHTITDACALTQTGRTSLYDAIHRGDLKAVKRGRRTLIHDDELRRWTQSLPTLVHS
ncbi:MAG TPA: helix-turn-helix domain-containing protein [Acidobacteriaceae bacterium]